MLVLDPSRRYTIDQIKRHRWMLIEIMDPVSMLCDTKTVGGNAAVGTAAVEPNEQILRLMAGLGIDAQKTRDSLKVCSRCPLPHSFSCTYDISIYLSVFLYYFFLVLSSSVCTYVSFFFSRAVK